VLDEPLLLLLHAPSPMKPEATATVTALIQGNLASIMKCTLPRFPLESEPSRFRQA
jgi:hypothetical protein